MRLALLPRSSGFYELFSQAGENAVAVAQKAELRFREWPNPSVMQDEVKELEHVGDTLTRDIVQLLNTQYVTPFDREDIYELATELDDVVDHVEHASELLGLYGVDSPSRHSLEQCSSLVAATGAMSTAIAALRTKKGVHEALVDVKRHEDEADRVLRDALATLFHTPGIDPLLVIRWKDIYEALEAAIDACETVANVIGNVVVKNA
jgi:predicted phosphate transport protein (TIGR00153 family)